MYRIMGGKKYKTLYGARMTRSVLRNAQTALRDLFAGRTSTLPIEPPSADLIEATVANFEAWGRETVGVLLLLRKQEAP